MARHMEVNNLIKLKPKRDIYKTLAWLNLLLILGLYCLIFLK